MNRKTEIQVGVTVLAAIAILVAGLAWLKDYAVGRDRRTWLVEFPQTGGLAASDEVQVNGLRKGEVLSMELKGERVLVKLNLDKEITLTTDSKVAIRNLGMMGEKVVAVDLRTAGRPYRPDETIPGEFEMGLGEAMGEMGTTIETVSRLATHLEAMARTLSEKGMLGNTLDNFTRTSEELRLTVSENRAAVKSVLDDFAATARTAKHLTADREAELQQTLDHFAAAAEKMDHLSGRLDSLRAVMQNVSDRVNRGEGTLGKLVSDEQLYADLNESVRSLRALIEDVKANPKKYFKFSVF